MEQLLGAMVPSGACGRWLTLCIRKRKPTGTLYVMTSSQSMPYLDLFLRDRLHVLSRIVWHCDSSGGQAKSRYGSTYEPLLPPDKNYVRQNKNGVKSY